MSRFDFPLNSPATAPPTSQPKYLATSTPGEHNVYQFLDSTPFPFFNLRVAKNTTPLFTRQSALPPSFSISSAFRPLVLHGSPITSHNSHVFYRLPALSRSCASLTKSTPLQSSKSSLFSRNTGGGATPKSRVRHTFSARSAQAAHAACGFRVPEASRGSLPTVRVS
jgi:hypothetical protein